MITDSGEDQSKPPVKKRDAAKTRRRLIAAGEKLFATLGFAEATTEAIAKIAGVNKAMIAYYFGGKAGLYEAVLEDIQAEFLDRLRSETINADPKNRLRHHISLLSDIYCSRPRAAMMIMREHLDMQNLSQASAPFSISAFYDNIAEIFADRTNGEARPGLNVKFLHMQIVGAAIFFAIAKGDGSSRRGNLFGLLDEGDVEEFSEQMQQTITEGVFGLDNP